MHFLAVDDFDKRKPADLLVLPYWQCKGIADPAAPFGKYKVQPLPLLMTKDFVGKQEEICLFYPEKGKEPRVLLLGLGEKEKLSVEQLRRSYANAIKLAMQKKCSHLNVVVPQDTGLSAEEVIRGVAEGLLLANYTFDKLKHASLKEESSTVVKQAVLVGVKKPYLSLANKSAAIARAVYLARDLVNGNADDVTPQYLAGVAKQLSRQWPHVKTTLFDKKRIEQEKMELILAVSRGSRTHSNPIFIIVEYKGNPTSKEHIVLLGKGITYDTGGLNMKPTGSMETMKCDMGGAAAVLGALQAAAELKLKLNVTAVIAAAENAVSDTSYKPGDVYRSYSGKTVEIVNTDAEGRLVLADALAYTVKKLHPTCMVDIATLTGAMEIALGPEFSGLLSNDEALSCSLVEAGNATFERVHPMPLVEEYKVTLKSSIADLKNHGGRKGGGLIAALFLQEFVGNVPWAHLDIAGTAFYDEARRYHPKYATGVGVRLLTEFLERWQSRL